MRVTTDDLVEEILLHLDESPELMEDAIEYGSSSFDLRGVITRLLPVAGERVILSSDLGELTEWKSLEGGVRRVRADGGDSRRVVSLPDDFLRLVYIRMSDWPEAEMDVIPSGNAIAGLRRHWERRSGGRRGSPGLAFGYNDGERVLEIYGSVDGSRVAEGGYLPRPSFDGDGSLIFPPSLRHFLVDETVRMINGIRE